MDMLNKVMFEVKQMLGGYSDNVYKDLENRLMTLGLDSPIVTVVEVKKEIYVQKKPQRMSIKFWAMDWLNAKNMSYEKLAERTKKSEVVKVRHRFCIEAYKEGYTVTAIAKYLNIKFGSVYNATKKITK